MQFPKFPLKVPTFAPGERAYVLTKWLIFAVGIPLLPIGAKVLAEWIDEGQPNWSFSNLFSDGELLVLATVIAAAGIGDLVFDLRRSKRARGFRDAFAIAVALVIVVVSVTLYALVTLKREQLTPAQQAAAGQVTNQQNNVNALKAQLTEEQAALNKAQAQANTDFQAYEAEVNGTNGRPAGGGPLAQQLFARYQDAQNVTKELRAQVNTSTMQLNQEQQQLAKAQQAVNQSLQGTTPEDASGEGNRAADASVWMFGFGLVAGVNCLLTGSARSHEKGENKNNGHTDEDPAEMLDGVLSGNE